MNLVVIALIIFLFNALVALGGHDYAEAAAFGVMAIFCVAVAIWNEVCGLSPTSPDLRSPDTTDLPPSDEGK